MAQKNCAACDDLRNDAPNFVVNGLTNTEIASLKNNTGLNPSNSNDDCKDLNNMNDCLIGNSQEEVELYDVCDWKDYMKKFVGNVWTMFAGLIAAICGIWTNIKNMLARLKKLECLVDYLFQGASFNFAEDDTSGSSYIVAGKGVSFLNVSASGTASDIFLAYIAGGLAKLIGSCLFYTSDFTDRKPCYNYDNKGVNPTQSASRLGNPKWNATDTKPEGGSELVYEIRLKKSEYPQIKTIFSGLGLESQGGAFHILVAVVQEGQYASGQSGQCDANTGAPAVDGADRGHLVPAGWTYIQVRVSYIDQMNGNANGQQYSPNCLLGIRMNQDKIGC